MGTLDEEVSGTRHIWTGLFFGTVEDIQDPERLGRVKIRVFQVHHEDKNQEPTESLPWAPYVSFGGAPGSGAYWVPQVGAQVVVGFFHGDPSKPICLGTVYRQTESPVEVRGRAADSASNNGLGTNAFPGSNASQTILGATQVHELATPGGRFLLLDDSPSTPDVVLASQLHVLTQDDHASRKRFELQSGAGHNLTFWDVAPTKLVLTSVSGHRTTYSDDTADPSMKSVTHGGHSFSMSDLTSKPEIRLQSTGGGVISINDKGSGTVSEIRVNTKKNVQLVLQDNNDNFSLITSASNGIIGKAADYVIVQAGTGSTVYRVACSAQTSEILIETSAAAAGAAINIHAGNGQIVLEAVGQINMHCTGAMTISSDTSITMTAPTISLNP